MRIGLALRSGTRHRSVLGPWGRSCLEVALYVIFRFALDGGEYEIDLAKQNAEALRGELIPFVEAERKAGRGKPPSSAVWHRPLTPRLSELGLQRITAGVHQRRLSSLTA
ncbi:histone-like nucleoid-structuring protein Lsr2 [Pseudarthrobacter sp. NPDC058196]|uniref:Lsr2 dimerization domain-containing protein n=1 Tax=Pseudarthrobacter sp. NPDC058196 TaxID=3346376 RepID=UPI0036DBA1CB